MGEGQMEVIYEYWPKGELVTSDPIAGRETATSLRHAMKIANDLKEKHRNDLLFVDVVIRLVG